MTFLRTLTAITGSLLTAALVAQMQKPNGAGTASQPDRTFAVVERSSLRTFQGDWPSSGPLLRYVHDHPGTYVVFAQQGSLYRLDTPDQMAEVQRLYAPMQEFSARQEALSQAQKPLAQNQRTLAAQQRAENDPVQKGHIGEAQGALGQEQGDLGAMQGEIGRQQEEVAKAAYKRVQAIIDRCLTNGACPRISS